MTISMNIIKMKICQPTLLSIFYIAKVIKFSLLNLLAR